VRVVLVSLALAGLAACGHTPKTNAACECLTKADVESAIPGLPFQEGVGSFTDDFDEDYASASCKFHTVSERPWMNVHLELYDGKPQQMTIAELKHEAAKDKRVDVHEVSGLGDGALWNAIPPGYKYDKSYHLSVLKHGNKLAELSAVGIRDDQAEQALSKLAALALGRFEKMRSDK